MASKCLYWTYKSAHKTKNKTEVGSLPFFQGLAIHSGVLALRLSLSPWSAGRFSLISPQSLELDTGVNHHSSFTHPSHSHAPLATLSNTPRTGRSRKTSAVDDRNIVTAVKKDPKTTVSDISNNLQRAGVKVSQSTVRRRLHEQKYRGYTRRCKPLISKKNRRQASKILGQGFID